MFRIEIDYSQTVRPPRISAASGIALAARLLNAAPPDPSPGERRTLDRVKVGSDRVLAILLERERFQPQRLRPVLGPFSLAWSSMEGALEAAGKLPVDPTGRAEKSRAAHDSLFGDGLGFLAQDATSAWLSGHLLVDKIAADGLAPILDEVVGPLYLAAAKSATIALGDAIGVGAEPRRMPSTTSLAEAMAQLSHEIGAYGRQLVASVDDEVEATVRRFVLAAEPLEAHRAMMRAAESGSDEGTASESDGDVVIAEPGAEGTEPSSPSTPSAAPVEGTTPAE
jgi:hypothetical protein